MIKTLARPTKKTLTEILPTVGAPVDNIENWIRPGRLQLMTRFEETTQGRARLFSRENALELASISAFVKAGVPVSAAVAMAAAILRHDQYDHVREWWVFAAGEYTKGNQFNTVTMEVLKPRLDAASPPVLTMVNTGEIVRRVNKLFEAD